MSFAILLMNFPNYKKIVTIQSPPDFSVKISYFNQNMQKSLYIIRNIHRFVYILVIHPKIRGGVLNSYHYNNDAMKLRNTRLVELADEYCICYWNVNNFRSGTGQTVRMAKRKEIKILNLYENLSDTE